MYDIAPDIQQHIRICLSVECSWDNQVSDIIFCNVIQLALSRVAITRTLCFCFLFVLKTQTFLLSWSSFFPSFIGKSEIVTACLTERPLCLFSVWFKVTTFSTKTKAITRLLPNRSPVAWGSQRIALGALIFHSNTFHFICWAPKFSAFSSEGPFKIFLGSSLELNIPLSFLTN